MKLQRQSDKVLVEASIKKLIETEFAGLKGSPNFKFDWSLEKHSDVYKIFLLSDVDEVLGLVSVLDDPEFKRIHIDLVKSSVANQGKNKQYDFIAGCQIAFAVSLTYEYGYNGFVSLDPKLKLVDLYKKKYGFEEFGYQMISQGENSKLLVDKYLLSHEEE